MTAARKGKRMEEKGNLPRKDAEWMEVVNLAQQYGFIVQYHGDTVMLLHNRRQEDGSIPGQVTLFDLGMEKGKP